MRYLLLIFFILIFSISQLHSQILKGKVTNQSGEPVQYSTVYFQELRQGTTANVKGDYEIKLKPGKYTVVYQSLGYEPIFVTVNLTDKTVVRDVTLPVQYYQIPEVRISASGEDPAYIIMRKVIGMAPYYLNNISYYKAEVYLKGNVIFKKIPKLLQKSMKMSSDGESTSVGAGGKKEPEKRLIREGDAFMMESLNEIEFTAPDRYVQKMISYNSTFPEESNDLSPMGYIEASFYQPVLAEMAISPLSPQAFSHYKFRYLGATLQGNYTINKIEVIPKRKSQQLFEGTIYIIEDLWCLHSVDLINNNRLGEFKIQQVYIPVQDDIWMPVSHKFEVRASIFGLKADAGYGGSIKYLDVKPNLALEKPKTVSTDYGGRTAATVKPSETVPPTKERQQIEKILEKDDLSNRDMVKLSRLMEKESEKSINDTTGNNLEIRDNTIKSVEKNAAKKDSAYWSQIRPVPLTETDIKSLRIRDSIRTEYDIRKPKDDTTGTSSPAGKKRIPRTLKYLATGHTWGSNWRDTTHKYSFTWGGLVDLRNLRFNTVDGFVYGIDLRYQRYFKERSSLSIYPEVSWAFSRESLLWRVNANYNFNSLYQQQAYFRIGSTSRDIGNGGSINPLLNSITSLFFENNYLKLYDSRYVTLGFKTTITNGLTLEISSTRDYRRVLENTTDFSVIKTSKDYTANIPENSYLDSLSNPFNKVASQNHNDITAKISYTPFQKYSISKGRRIPRGSDWPTFSLSWQHGINEFIEMDKRVRHYDMIRFEAYKRYDDIGAFSELRWRIRAGGFLDSRNVPFYDFFHFNPQPPMVLINDYQDAFMLPGYYSLSTPEAFGEFHIKYTTPYLLVKLLPVLSNTLMRENVSIAYLGSKNAPHYTEIGYSISEIFFLAELGIYVGFEDLGYKNIGGKLILKFN
ncbi:MAG TPA: DUF5686 family protein [Bacteroidales bacterium]|nr:DUF5686 family protein [Bacteroidales bacterium]